MRQAEAAALQAQVLQERARAPLEAPQQAAGRQQWRLEAQVAEGSQQQQEWTVGQQQQQQQELDQFPWLAGHGWEEQQEQQFEWGAGAVPQAVAQPAPQAGVRGPLQEVHSNLPPPSHHQQRQHQVRPGSAALSDCPADVGRYSYPDVAEAGYAAGLAAAAAEGAPGLAVDTAAGAASDKMTRWQQRRLHVVHSNALFSEGEGD
jgi:hypothetical protein